MDLDGVLVNWHKGACHALGVPYPHEFVFQRDWICSVSGMPIGTVLTKLDSTPDFWSKLEPTLTAANLVRYLDTNFPDWGILTSATHNSASWAGKAEWVKTHLGTKGLHRLTICCGNKARFVSPSALLIDDTHKIVRDWLNGGGLAYHWIEYSDDQSALLQRQFESLTQYLDTFREN